MLSALKSENITRVVPYVKVMKGSDLVWSSSSNLKSSSSSLDGGIHLLALTGTRVIIPTSLVSVLHFNVCDFLFLGCRTKGLYGRTQPGAKQTKVASPALGQTSFVLNVPLLFVPFSKGFFCDKIQTK